MSDPATEQERHPIGHAWLRRELRLPVPPPAVESYIVAGARRTETHGSRVVELYPRQYSTDGSVVSNLRFALRHEPVDLGVLAAALKAVDAADIEAWVRREPTGAFSRRAWFFHETVTGRTLDLEDAGVGNYVEALDPTRHIVAERRNSRRHRVADNLLGGPGLCPTVRRTPRLTEAMRLRVDEEARALIESYDPVILARAVDYLYTKETRSSFAIEGETPSASRTERFVAALRAAPGIDPADKAALVRLQGDIVDRRYAASDWRNGQNFVGATVGGYREEVHFICPRPEDVPGLMDAWTALMRRVVEGGVPPRRGGGGLRLRFRLHPPVRGRERPYPPLPDASRSRQARLRPARHDLAGIGGHSARPARLRRDTREFLTAAFRVHPLALDGRPGARRRE